MKNSFGNISGLKHENVDTSVYVQYTCVKCGEINVASVGDRPISPQEAFDTAIWTCKNPSCGYKHSKHSDLPFNWPDDDKLCTSQVAINFWKYFFKDATETRERFWKYCKSCGRLLPVTHFNVHDRIPKKKGGPLNTQLECRACKNSIVNTNLNKKRTPEQKREASTNSELGDLFAKDGHKKFSNEKDLFNRFENRCFCCGKSLDISNRSNWSIDHITPSSFFYPLTYKNAALLCKECNAKKSNKWPSEFYDIAKLNELAILTKGDIALWTGPAKYNDDIYPNEAINRQLVKVRANCSTTTLNKRRVKLKKIIESYHLEHLLNENSKTLLHISDKDKVK